MGACPAETTDKLTGPERGFYSILRYTASDAPSAPPVPPAEDGDTLALAEINLLRYADAALPDRALYGIADLLRTPRRPGCALIVRFLYDWDGRNRLTEPKTIGAILRHMEQLGPVLRENADRIYLSQGLFIGNWGEMHGSRFLRSEDLKRLYAAFTEATAARVRTSLRTPKLWRSVTGMTLPTGAFPAGAAALPGLFNDGMLGSVSDYGTYGDDPADRERELTFQDSLCRIVPNGGEVVGCASQSDAENAMAELSRMHVSYLNRDYDAQTLAKWRAAAVRGQGIWDGRSCFDYAEAHLGYRFVIRSVRLRRQELAGGVAARVAVENVGFAPLYHAANAELVFVRERSAAAVFPMTGSVDRLVSGMGPREFTLRLSASEARLGAETYDIYFRLVSLKYGVIIQTANEGCNAWGCPIGRYIGK